MGRILSQGRPLRQAGAFDAARPGDYLVDCPEKPSSLSLKRTLKVVREP